MNKILTHIKSLIFLIIHIIIVIFITIKIQNNIFPNIIFASWMAYILWGLCFSFIEFIIFFPLKFSLYKLVKFHRSKMVQIIGIPITIICFLSTLLQLWNFIFALYYTGFWEYFWAIILSILLICIYGYLVALLFNLYKK